ncbi:MAG TPA: SCP2 sterol-binding domain-containing protein [Rudaea sp.]
MSEDRKPNPLLATLGRALEGVLNRAVALDAPTRDDLAALEGRRIGVELRGMDLALAIGVEDGRLRVGPHWERGSDLNLRATPGSLLAFALRRGDNSALPPGKVDVSGDAELARRIEKLMRGFRPDIEEAFARTFGDVLGVPIARAVRSAFEFSRDSARSFAANTAEYLREESRDLVAPGEMDGFLDDVDTLRERAERLEARVARLARRGAA